MQDKIISEIKRIKQEIFPNTTLLYGDFGAEFSIVIDAIKDHLGLESEDITDAISYERIQDIYLNSTPKVYTINILNLTEKQQNVLLKFVEEPLSTSYIVLTATYDTRIIDTLANRCFVLFLDTYKYEEIKHLIKYTCEDESYLKYISTTPYLIEKYNNYNIEKIYNLCKNISERLQDASFQNTLTISGNLKFSEDLEFDLFLRTLLYTICMSFKNSRDSQRNNTLLDYYSIVREHLVTERRSKILARDVLFDNLLTELWSVAHAY